MFILGLSGGMGMGKSAASRYFSSFHIPVHDSDEAVHRLMNKGHTLYQKIKDIIPEAAKKDKIDRQILSNQIKEDPGFLKKLEEVIHPQIRKDRDYFLRQQALMQQKLVVLDVPLLFEVGLYKRCDAVAIVDCPLWLQNQRLLKRGISQEKRKLLLNNQWPNHKRKLYSNYIIPTGLSFAYSHKKIRIIIKDVSKKIGIKYTALNYSL